MFNRVGQANQVKKILMISASIFINACAMPADNQAIYKKSKLEIAQKPVLSPYSSDYTLSYGNDQKIQKAYQQYLKTGKAPNIITQGFEQFAYGASQPVIDTSPFELTVITLEKGENITNVSSGDPKRWSYSLAYSGVGIDKEAHILLKPSFPNISTNFVITTDKRLYTLKIVSLATGKYARNVSFWYPDEVQQYWDNMSINYANNNMDNNTPSELAHIDLKNMNFNYKIDAPFSLFSSLPWKPIKVFDDGIHTYIQFSDKVSNRDLPALFTLNDNTNQKELVNYHVKKPYFIVDKIFKKAVLVLGVGSSQTSITIINQDYN